MAHHSPKLIVEYDGGTWARMGHSTGAAIDDDNEKLNAAVMHGYYVMRFTKYNVIDGSAIRLITEFLSQKRRADVIL